MAVVGGRVRVAEGLHRRRWFPRLLTEEHALGIVVRTIVKSVVSPSRRARSREDISLRQFCLLLLQQI